MSTQDELQDLKSAIEKAEEAVRLTPVDSADLVGRLNNFGNKLLSRYKRTGPSTLRCYDRSGGN